MAKLETSISQTVDDFINKAKEHNNAGNYSLALNNLVNAWDILPAPREDFDESYYVVKYIIQLSLRNKDLETARKWISKIYDCDKDRIDGGEREYLHGRVEFEGHNYEDAKTYFKIAFQKSEGRFPAPQEKEYLNLIRG